MRERKIAWQKWVDEVVEDIEDLDDLDEIDDDNGLHMLELPSAIRTPLGAYGQFETMSPSNMFDCWFCYTNFDITEEDKNALDLVDGIEALRIVSRYRFFIGIGKMFTLTEVRPLVEIALNINQHSIIAQIIAEISGKRKWAIGIYEDGSYTSITSDSDNDEEYNSKLNKLRLSTAVNIVTSDEV